GRECQAHVSGRHRRRHCLRGAGRRDRGAHRFGLSRHGRPGVDPLLRGDRAGRHRLAARRLGPCASAWPSRCVPQAGPSKLCGRPGVCGNDRGADRAAPGSVSEHRLVKDRVDSGLLIVLALAAGAVPFLFSGYEIKLATTITIQAGLAVALGLVVGPAGLTSVGHAAFYGLAAYLLAMMAPKSAPADLLTTVIVAILGAAAFAAPVAA